MEVVQCRVHCSVDNKAQPKGQQGREKVNQQQEGGPLNLAQLRCACSAITGMLQAHVCSMAVGVNQTISSGQLQYGGAEQQCGACT